jgi:hypothetical protein
LGIAILFLVFGWNKLHILWVAPVAHFAAQALVIGGIPILSPIVLFATRIFLFIVLIGVEKPNLENDAQDNNSDSDSDALLAGCLAADDDWKYFYSEKSGDFFYDPQSVFRGRVTTKVWVKNMLSDKGKVTVSKNYYQANGIKNISHFTDRWEINCSKNTARLVFTALSDSKGNVVFSADDPSPFVKIPPEGKLRALVEIICEKGGK